MQSDFSAERAMPLMPQDLEQRSGSGSYDGGAAADPPRSTQEPGEADVPWVSMETAPRRERDPASAYASYGRSDSLGTPAEIAPPPRKSPLQALLGNRVALLAVLVVVLVAAAIPLLLRPRGGSAGVRTTSVAEIRKNARAYDGRSVTVKGTVGLVFSVGQGHTYYLHQGKDTLIVFTRGPGPDQGRDITVNGSISTGEMDGVPRPTLFETTR